MICPNCQIDVAISEQLFGALYTCGGCQAVYFINFEGQPEFGEVSSGVLSEIVAEPETVQESAFESSLEPLVDSVDMVNFDNKLDEQLESYINSDIPQTDAFNPFEQPQMENLDEQSANSFKEIAKEISDFGNAEAHQSGMNYELQISGLDTQVAMRLFKEIIEDPRFGWDANELMRRVKNGAITFEKLNPVKAYVLAKRLQFLDIEKKWKQNAMS